MGLGGWIPQKLKEFAEIVYAFWLQKVETIKSENFAHFSKFISWLLASVFHGGWGLSDMFGGWAHAWRRAATDCTVTLPSRWLVDAVVDYDNSVHRPSSTTNYPWSSALQLRGAWICIAVDWVSNTWTCWLWSPLQVQRGWSPLTTDDKLQHQQQTATFTAAPLYPSLPSFQTSQ